MGKQVNVSLYMGRAGTGKTYAAYEWIQKKLEEQEGKTNATIILLVPDAATYKAERDLAQFMGGGFTSVRVVGFSRLAYQIYQSLGAGAQEKKGLSKVGRNLLLRLVMKRCEKQLEVFASAVKEPQFSNTLQALLQELKSFQISSDQLRQGAQDLKEGTLQGKLNELALLVDAYDDMLDSHMCDDRDGMELLIEALPQSPIMDNAYVVVDGFHWFTPLQYELLYALVEQAQEALFTATLPTDAKALADQQIPGALFGRPYEVYENLKGHYGSALRIKYFEENHRFLSKQLQDLGDGFFVIPQRKSHLGEEDRISLIEAYNREREADEVVRRILALVEDTGARYRDIMIVLRDSDSYGDSLEKTFQTYEVPYFMDRQTPMKTHPLGELLTGLFDVVRYNYNHDSLFRLLKTDLVMVDPDLDLEKTRARVDELENYCLEFGVHHYKWDMPSWPWCRKGRDGKPYSNSEEERFERVNESHDLVMDWLGDWFEFAAQADGHTGQDWAQELYGLLEQLKVPQTLFLWAQEAEEKNDQVEKSSHEQMYRQVMNFLDELAKVGAEELLTLDEMALLLEEALGDVNYSMVPPTLDHVLVTTVERGYTQEREHVFVMGLNDGVFPRKMGEEGLIKDKERLALAALDLRLAGGALVQAFNENFLFYLACSRARQSLTLSYANSTGEGEAQEASLVIKRLGDLGYTQKAFFVPLHVPEGDEGRYLWRPLQALSLLSARWGNLMDGESLTSPWWALYGWALRDATYRPRLQEITRGLGDSNTVKPLSVDVVDRLFLSQDSCMTGSVTRLEKYQECPFKFYAQYGLKLKPRKVASYGAPEIGTLLHDHLRRLGEELLAEGKQWSDLDPDQQKARCQAIAAEVMDPSLLGYADLADSDGEAQEEGRPASDKAYNKARYDRLLRTLESTVARLADWSSKSDFSMTALEKSFGMGEEWDAIDVPLPKNPKDHKDRHLLLQGQIDRIDTWQDGDLTYGLIMDYKTGNAGISGGQLYYGLKLQLLTYWMAYTSVPGNESIIPAGTIYTPVKNTRLTLSSPVTKEEAGQEAARAKEFKSFGYFTNNVDVLLHMDDIPFGQSGGLYVPIRISGGKKATKTKPAEEPRINNGDLGKTKSYGQYRVMTEYVKLKMAHIASHIGEGDFPIAPYKYENKNACSYCDYKAVCRFESKRNSYNNLPKLSEDQAMEKMVEATGLVLNERGNRDGNDLDK